MPPYFNIHLRYPSFTFFSCCQANHQTVSPHQRGTSHTANTTDGSLTPAVFSRQNTATASSTASPKEFLIERGVSRDASELYAEPMTKQLEAFQCLATTSSTEVNQALRQWQSAFANTPLNPLAATASAWPSNTYFEPLDSQLIQDLQTEVSQPFHGVFTTNLFAAVLSTYQSMNACRQNHGLLYHQPRHAAEMLEDVHRLLNQYAQPLNNFHLLVVLCALFHDIRFTRQRIVDECASCEDLKRFLDPTLQGLSAPQQRILNALIDIWIIGATLPCFLSKNLLGQKAPTLASLAKLTAEYSATLETPKLNDNCLSVALNLAQLIAEADIQRSCFPMLQSQPAYTTPHWQTLSFILNDLSQDKRLAAQLRLSQNLRTLAEMNSHRSATLYPFAKTIALHQNRAQVTPMEWSEPLIRELASLLSIGPLSETAFAERMSNSHTPGVDHSQTEPTPISDTPEADHWKNEWPQHIDVLEKLHNYLMSNVALTCKQELVSALATAAADQHGSQLDLIEIQRISEDMQAIAGFAPSKTLKN